MWRTLQWRVRQQVGDPDMENSVHSPGEHADGVLPETHGLPQEPTEKQKHWQEQETKTWHQATIAYKAPEERSEPVSLTAAYRHIKEIRGLDCCGYGSVYCESAALTG